MPEKAVQRLSSQLYDFEEPFCRYRCLPEIDRSLVVLVDEDRPLGRGAFGHVYLGRLHNVDTIDSKENLNVVEVAVKLASGTLHAANKAYALAEDASANAQSFLLHEAEIMNRIGRCAVRLL